MGANALRPPWTGRRATREKKRFTVKNTLISDADRFIHYLGPTTPGATHDYELLKREFDVNLGLLEAFDWLADLGYLGLVTDYDVAPASLPHRKPRRSKAQPKTSLTPQQLAQNRHHARHRVKVENAIAGSKRLGAVSQVCRNKATSFADRLLAIACGIWNWFILNKANRI